MYAVVVDESTRNRKASRALAKELYPCQVACHPCMTPCKKGSEGTRWNKTSMGMTMSLAGDDERCSPYYQAKLSSRPRPWATGFSLLRRQENFSTIRASIWYEQHKHKRCHARQVLSVYQQGKTSPLDAACNGL